MNFEEQTFESAAREGDFRSVLKPQRKLLEQLLDLVREQRGHRAHAFQLLTQTAARLLQAERVTVWGFELDGDDLVSHDTFSRSDESHRSGERLHAYEYSTWFSPLRAGDIVKVDDALDDHRVAEFKSRPRGRLVCPARLDVPVFSGRKVIGVLSHEHRLDTRVWERWEEIVAASLADCAGVLLALDERGSARRGV